MYHRHEGRPPTHTSVVTLAVDVAESRIQYSMLEPDSLPFEASVDGAVLRAGYVRDLLAALSDLNVMARRDGGYGDATNRLRGHGAACFRELLPQYVQDRLKQLPVKTYLGISVNADIAPWESLYDGRRFLGDKFFVFRLPRPRLAVGHVVAAGKVNGVRRPALLTVLGGSLDLNPSEFYRSHDDLFGKHGEIVEKPSLTTLINVTRDAAYIYLYCHGHPNPIRLQIADSESTGECLEVSSVVLLRPTRGAVVLLNACGSLAPQGRLEAYGNFGWAFCVGGAQVVVGTNSAISEADARAFGDAFFGFLSADVKSARIAPPGRVREAFLVAKGSSRCAGCTFCFYGPVAAMTVRN